MPKPHPLTTPRGSHGADLQLVRNGDYPGLLANTEFKSVLDHLERIHNSEIHRLSSRLLGGDVPQTPTSARKPPTFQPQEYKQADLDEVSPRQPAIQPEPEWKKLVESTIDSFNLRPSEVLSDAMTAQPTDASQSTVTKLFKASTFDEESERKNQATRNSYYFHGEGSTSTMRRLQKMLDMDAAPEDFTKGRALLWTIVNSIRFEAFSAAVVVANAIFLGFRLDHNMRNPDNMDPAYMRVCEYVFTVLFSLELALRLSIHGCRVYLDQKVCHWYWLDTFVVATSLIEAMLEFLEDHSGGSVNISSARTFRIVRVVRLIRGVRIARVVRFVRALRMLVLSIIHTMKSVLWAYLLLLIIIYVFGLIFAQGVNDHVIDAGVSSDSLYLYWGTLPRAMLTLYKTISGGLNWHDCVTPLAEVGAILVALFVGYISFAVFAVLNVITGIFCEAAIESSRKDHEMMIQQHLTEKENFTNAVCELFGVDKGEKGEDVWISYREFEDVLTHPKTSAYLATMQLDITDAWELFKLLDTDESSYIDVEEFVHGILRLKGLAKAIDVAKLDYEQKIRQKRLAKHMVAVDAKLTKIQKAMSICLSQSQQPTPLNATSEDDLFGPEPA